MPSLCPPLPYTARILLLLLQVLKLLLLVALLVLSYALVEAVEGSYLLSLTCYSIATVIFLGLQQVSDDALRHC